MKKKIIILSLLVLSLGLIIIKSNDNTFTKDNILFAINLDGSNVSSFPSSGDYKSEITCSGQENAIWDPTSRKIILDNTTDETRCSVSFTTITNSDYLNNYIISLAGNGEVVNENLTTENFGYRYEGKNPSNYVWFNNELWRIIGVFNSEYHGKTGDLVKIVRAEELGRYSFSESSSTFVDSYIYNLLNGAYINASDSWIDTTNCKSYIFDTSGGSTIPSVCNFTQSGIKSDYLNMVEDAYWLINSFSVDDVAKSDTFSISSKTSTSFKIGLMSLNEYAYASPSSCTNSLYTYHNSIECAEKNWLYGKGYEFTLTPYENNENYSMFAIYPSGYASVVGLKEANVVRPSLYLKSNTYIVSGTGTISDPYIIGLSS